MLKIIRNYFDSTFRTESEVETENQLKLATTDLLIEIMLRDEKVIEQYQKTIKDLIRKSFALTGMAGGYNRNSAKKMLFEVYKNHGQAGVDKLIQEFNLEKLFGFKSGTSFKL